MPPRLRDRRDEALGLSAAMELAIALVNAFTAGHSAFGLTGETTCNPLPPEVLTNDARPRSFNRARTPPPPR